MFGIPSKKTQISTPTPSTSWFQEITLTITSFILRFLVPEAWSSERRKKADCFVDNLEESFTENRTPYDDDHIDKVDRTIRRFLNNYSSSIPPLTSPQEICDIISKLNTRKAPGHDQIKNIALKSLPMNAITHLTKIFNKCLLLQHFPQIWKHCTISLLPKKNKDPKFPLNYRPISLISCVAKLFEKILLSRIQAFSDSNHIIPDFQHGFRKKTSTCHQLLRTTNLIIDGFNTHRTTGGIFLDVEKAFDRVWHNGLIFKLIQINLPPYLIKIIYEYLNNRTFQVKINSIHSRIGSIQAGTPQGSILSPLLYSLYTYDFPTSPTVEVCLFADDAAILSQARSPEIFNFLRRTFQHICDRLKPQIKRHFIIRKPIPVERRVAVTLVKLGSSGELRTVANLFGIARCTACIIVREVCTALCNTFKITFPTQRDLDAIATECFDRSALPGCCGALDGCHIPIKAPSLNIKDYFFRKQFHSLILQAVVDGNSHFMNINVGWLGSVHDARVFRNSVIFSRCHFKIIFTC
ncbi:RNA-directed DNA polymerase from mobile element jockey [Trichonephila clavipes]|nr:RNA-directed DNA polymerase from mobile element jockey [Trichonephila clavipes]